MTIQIEVKRSSRLKYLQLMARIEEAHDELIKSQSTAAL